MKYVFKEFAFACDCGYRVQRLQWDYDPVPSCPAHGPMHECAVRHSHAVFSDDLPNGPYFCETLGPEPVWVTSKSHLAREAEKRGLINIVEHDDDYYAKRRNWHDEELRDAGTNREY